jgi:hypothetical protein
MEAHSKYPTFEVNLRESLSSKYVLKVSRISTRDMSDSNFLLSCLPQIDKFLVKLKRLTFIKAYPNIEKPIEILRLLLSLNDSFEQVTNACKMLHDYCELKILRENVSL